MTIGKTCFALPLLLAGTFASTIVAAHSEHSESKSTSHEPFLQDEFEIILHGAENSMHEHCEYFESGDVVRFSFHSPYAVEFDVHHHTDTDTFFPITANDVTRLTDQFKAETGKEYCFNFVNKTYHDAKWKFPVTFEVIRTF